MIQITDKSYCSGCKACKNACAFDAIRFEYDDEGFWYPQVDTQKCVNCKRCEAVCPYKAENHGVSKENLEYDSEFYAARLKEESLLFEVSSGGAFQAFAMKVILSNGIVYGAAQEKVDHIFHYRACNLEDLKRTRRSKYFQSDIDNCYRLAKKDLDLGNIVLFSGTGCQIAGLNCFLGKKYQNLYTCEVVCHGVPSYFIWKKYRQEKEELEGKKIVDLIFRDKSDGWSNNQYKITYDDGSFECERSTEQLFHAGYLKGLFYRPSCGSCPFARMPRTADITLADYWKYKGELNNDNRGVSLITVNNSHGKELFDLGTDILDFESVTKNDALDSCRHLNEIPIENKNRKAFIVATLSKGYFYAAKKYICKKEPNVFYKIIKRIRHLLRRK